MGDRVNRKRGFPIVSRSSASVTLHLAPSARGSDLVQADPRWTRRSGPMALGVEQAWSERFADVFASLQDNEGGYRPDWYRGDFQPGRMGRFASNIGNSFSAAISSASVMARQTRSGEADSCSVFSTSRIMDCPPDVVRAVRVSRPRRRSRELAIRRPP